MKDEVKRIVFVSYPRLTKLANNVLNEETLNKISVIESSFENTIKIARELIEKDNADVFIAGGSNAQILKQEFPDLPLVTLSINAYDILRSLSQAYKLEKPAVFISYNNIIEPLNSLRDAMVFPIQQGSFTSKDDLELFISRIKKNKSKPIIIGSSLVCDCAEKHGLATIYIYSESSIKDAFSRAVELHKSIMLEKTQKKLLNTIIDYTYSGIIAINKDKMITVCNPAAKKILRLSTDNVINRPVDKVVPNSKLSRVLQTGEMELNKIQHLGEDQTILTNRIPIKVDDKIFGAVATFQDIKDVQKAEQQIRKQLAQKRLTAKYSFNDIVGNSKVINKTTEIARVYAEPDQTVLLYGETGTGKELFAQSIHNSSKRKKMPFVAINCAALPESLLESELFGYEEGTFTGAQKGGKAGFFELAHGGTIFLDEISEIPLKVQVHLLRFLQEKEILRVGGRKIIPVNTRVIAATNRNLWSKVEKGLFREDLFYRINVLYIEIPPLRQRKEDIPLLVKHITNSYCPDFYEKYHDSWQELIDSFGDYSWPGNIRELENIINRCCIIFDNKKNLKEEYSILLNAGPPPPGNGKQTDVIDLYNKYNEEYSEIVDTLNQVEWNREKAAKKLGMSRTTLWRKIKQYEHK